MADRHFQPETIAIHSGVKFFETFGNFSFIMRAHMDVLRVSSMQQSS